MYNTYKVVTENPNGAKYLKAHKKWLSEAKSHKGHEPADFKWDFINSLSDQIEKGVPLTGRQFKSLKRVCFFLGHNSTKPKKD